MGLGTFSIPICSFPIPIGEKIFQMGLEYTVAGLLVGSALDWSWLHRYYGPFHQVLRRPHTLIQSKESTS